MRNPSILRQKIWFSKIQEEVIGIDTVNKYSKPICKKLSVSVTAGTPEEIAAGIVPEYDRYITSYNRKFDKNIEEGMLLWVDREPEIDMNGELVISQINSMPTISPDYVLDKRISSKKSTVMRYGISKIGGA